MAMNVGGFIPITSRHFMRPRPVRRRFDAELRRSIPFRRCRPLTNRPDMVKINPSLMFTGACGDAFRRYASLFGGEIMMMLTYAESPLQQQEPREWGDKVWFARLRAGGLDITGGDVLAYE